MKENRCVLCNKIVPEGLQVCHICNKSINKQMQEIGVERTLNGVFCKKCGNELTKNGGLIFISYISGADFNGYKFACSKCREHIIQTFYIGG